MIPFIMNLNSKKLENNLLVFINGQSNAVGWNTGAPSESYLNDPISKTHIWTGSEFEQLEYPTNNNGFNGHGIELNLGYLASSVLDNIYIIKEAAGSTSLADNWNKATGNLYVSMITNFNNALANLTSQNKTINDAVFYFNQGERDALNLDDSNNYEANLIQYISDLRTDINIEDIKMIITRLSSNLTGRDYLNTVRTAQENAVANTTNSFLINQDDLTLQGDNIHFTSASQNMLAQNTYNLI